jgi:branched-chain amino acid transport system ATP-binding protein
MAEPILEIKDLSKSFGGIRAVDHFSFRVRRGTITGLIGPNGAGKTTFFNLVTGFLRPDSGHVIFKGEEITGLRPDQIFHRHICRTFQIPRPCLDMTVLENLMLVPPRQLGEQLWNPWFRSGLVRRQEAENRDRALRVLERVELIHLKDEYARTVSGGQKKLLELARTMMADPELILLDEPAAGVNPTLLKSLVKYIRRLAEERGVTILLIEHNMGLVMTLCNPIMVMNEGRTLVEGPPEVVREDPEVLGAYLGRRRS